MGFFRDIWRISMGDQKAIEPSPAQVAASASPEEMHSAARKLAQYLLDQGFQDDLLFDAMLDASSNTGVPTSEIDRAYDELQWARDNPIKVATLSTGSMRVLDLRNVPSTRMRIKGSANWVTDDERAKYGGTEYLLVREPANEFDLNAVAVYGKGRKVGYVSAVKAAALAPILDPLPFDAFLLGGTSVVENSIRLWVDVPKLPELRKFTKSLSS